jgi:hypothetical protein
MINLEKHVMKRLAPDKKSVQDLEPYINKILEMEKGQRVIPIQKKRKGQVCPNPICHNQEEEHMERDERMGQTTCKLCGTVVLERQIVDKEWVRKFEDDETDPSFHGPPPDAKFSSVHNLQTGCAFDPKTRKRAYELNRLQAEVELNLSTNQRAHLRSKEKITRAGYKDKEKVQAFAVMDEISDAVSLNDSILEKAKALFGRYRDQTEQVFDRDKYIAACMLIAIRGHVEIQSTTTSHESGGGGESYPCKHCDLVFSTKRDKIFHQRTCELKPAATTVL